MTERGRGSSRTGSGVGTRFGGGEGGPLPGGGSKAPGGCEGFRCVSPVLTSGRSGGVLREWTWEVLAGASGRGGRGETTVPRGRRETRNVLTWTPSQARVLPAKTPRRQIPPAADGSTDVGGRGERDVQQGPVTHAVAAPGLQGVRLRLLRGTPRAVHPRAPAPAHPRGPQPLPTHARHNPPTHPRVSPYCPPTRASTPRPTHTRLPSTDPPHTCLPHTAPAPPAPRAPPPAPGRGPQSSLEFPPFRSILPSPVVQGVSHCRGRNTV